MKKKPNVNALSEAGEVKRSRRSSKSAGGKASGGQNLPEVAKEEIVAREHLVGREMESPAARPAARKSVPRPSAAKTDGATNGTHLQEPANGDSSAAAPTAEEIARRAFEIWQETGRHDEVQNWLQAEAELRNRVEK